MSVPGNQTNAGPLVGSTFPLSLIRRKVQVEPVSLQSLRKALAGNSPNSFWGHSNTLKPASSMVGVDLTPRVERPTLRLNEEGFVCFEGEVFKECWVLSPDYLPGYRPAIGEEVSPEKITGWQVLKLTWEEET